jgi:hypothetical protein
MIKFIKELFKLISLSNPKNWELEYETDWSYEQDYWRSPRKHYKHKKYNYFITNAYKDKPIELNKLVTLFIHDYKYGLLLSGTRYFAMSH